MFCGWWNSIPITLYETQKNQIQNSFSRLGELVQLSAGVRDAGSYLRELQSFRGLAIFLVILFHVHGARYGLVPGHYPFLERFIVGGNTGVTLFFVLSGFLLSLPWLKHQLERGPRPAIGKFYVARALRILPLYWLFVLIAAIHTGKWLAGWQAIAFIPIGMDMFPFSIVWWTLSKEMQFYLLLPLGFYTWNHSKIGRSLFILILMSWAYLYFDLVVSNSVGILNPHEYFLNKSLFGRLPAFLVGIATAAVYLRLEHIHPANFFYRTTATLILVLALVMLGTILGKAGIVGDFIAEAQWHEHHFYESVLWSIICLTCLIGNPVGKSIICNLALAITGKLSYSLYLVHVPVAFYISLILKSRLEAGDTSLNSSIYAAAVLTLTISTLISYFTYRIVELPFLGLKAKR